MINLSLVIIVCVGGAHCQAVQLRKASDGFSGPEVYFEVQIKARSSIEFGLGLLICSLHKLAESDNSYIDVDYELNTYSYRVSICTRITLCSEMSFAIA